MTSNEWDILLWDIARKAADEKYKLHDDGFKPQEIAGKSKEFATAEFAKAYQKQLADRLKYDELDDEDRRVIKNYPISKMTNWLEGVQEDDPRRKSYEVKFDKFASLLDDNANKELGKSSWKDMDFVNDQAARNKAKELGYNLNKVEDRGEFFKKLAEFQTAYDRGIAADDMAESGWGKFNSYANPAAYEEAQRQVTTGEGTEADLYKMAAVDALANGLEWGLPGLRVTKATPMPVLGRLSPGKASVADAVLQGFAELGRQGAKVGVDPELEFSVAPAVAGTTAGMTRPAMMLSAQGILSQFQGPYARSFGRGVMKSTRSGDPRTYERDELARAIDQHFQNINDRSVAILDDSPVTATTPAEVVRTSAGDKAMDKLAALNVKKPEPIKSKQILQDMLANKGFRNTLSGADRKKLNNLEKRVNNPSWNNLEAMSDSEIQALTDKLNKINAGPGSKHDKIVAKAMAITDATGAVDSKELMDLGQKYYAYKYKEAALKAYDAPFLSNKDPKTGNLTPESKAQWDKLEKEFPQKMLDEKDASVYNDLGLKAGQLLANFGGRFEPTFKANPFNGNRLVKNDYKESDWYANMDPEKRAAFEKALADLTKSRRK